MLLLHASFAQVFLLQQTAYFSLQANRAILCRKLKSYLSMFLCLPFVPQYIPLCGCAAQLQTLLGRIAIQTHGVSSWRPWDILKKKWHDDMALSGDCYSNAKEDEKKEKGGAERWQLRLVKGPTIQWGHRLEVSETSVRIRIHWKSASVPTSSWMKALWWLLR